ncbi:MAG: hypothetical protein PHH47_13410 [Gallionella sp.]|nr:hypothetical protein [Gallionella sp.]MDD4946526.1 hypothetical protein [Gallionella sp.]MDD5612879.1 hypothetical protein [Gallionella sp.]
MSRSHHSLSISFAIAILLGVFASPVTVLAEELVEAEASTAPAHQDAVCDGKGRPQRVARPDGSFVEYFYHPTLDKVSAVVTNEVSTVYSYSGSGDLTRIFNTHDQLVTLDYDRDKHISRMRQSRKGHPDDTHELTFRYNRAGKPIIIRMAGIGTIRVKYDETGEIEKVESAQGAKMALAVLGAFQTLMQMVKVEGVD